MTASMWVCKKCNTDQSPGAAKYIINGTGHYCYECYSLFKDAETMPAGPPVDQNVLEEAAGLIYGDRKEQYGNAERNFGDIAKLWEPIIGTRISGEAVALCLLQLKVARAINDVRANRDIKRDTIVDLAGYAGCIEKIQKGL